MFDSPLYILATLACFVVLIILMIGIGGFAKGGEFNRKHANRLMRYRIAAQAVVGHHGALHREALDVGGFAAQK